MGEGTQVVRADMPIEGAPAPDLLLAPGKPCPADDESFDGILSTQVLHHVEDASFYLRDAYRMLRPGGRLILATHGIWRDAPTPLDLRRWTGEGLRREVEAAGFEVTECVPLTCGGRGLLQLLATELPAAPWSRRAWLSPAGLALGVLRRLALRRPASLGRLGERAFPGDATGVAGADAFYIDLLLSARRPGGP
jgi:SAM-dependent methyltransferase